jgi:hypothetical protein
MRFIATLAALAFTAALAAPSANAMEPQHGASSADDQPSISQKWVEANRFGGNDRD